MLDEAILKSNFLGRDGFEDEPKDLPELVSSDEEEGPAGGIEEGEEDSANAGT